MKVYVLGNHLISRDSLPLKFLPKLKKFFPQVNFIEIDPTEDFIPQANSIILDTVIGITKPRWFTSVADFSSSPRVSLHDYDLKFHLQLLIKLGKIKQILILGMPVKTSIKEVIDLLQEKLNAS